ncbi:Nitrate reductase [Lacunisphaera limnophila]|uniref:Nitrate reductase n=1 Tax=Lacunisphaera limnophila TaxID=1838286 RepID=A0A1D8AZ75_9BACT|nr:molybdopterin oxidoreductase family protein [Lacunisphaera limnophila]AOS46175.1 Nitrate reductase [Lacunisphaera limnophila]
MNTLDDLLHARTGPMTSELVQRPGDFGLGQLPARLAPAGTAKSICGYCSTGCSLQIHLNAAGEAINLTPDPDHPVNLGMACPKGWESLAPLAAPDRCTTPLLRDATGVLQPVTWPEALAVFTDRLKAIQAQHGPGSVAVLSTGQIMTEEMALLGALTKFGMGIADLDSNTRQCMATSHVAYKQSYGFDAPPFTYADFEESDVLVFVGANPCIAHPIMWQRVMRNRRQPTLIVVDPRRTETAMAATLHLPAYPKSDLTLLYGLAREVIRRGAVDAAFVAAHTTGFAAFATFVEAFTPARVSAETGLSTADLDRAAAAICRPGARVSYWWTMGVNQSHQATRTAQALINLSLMAGQIGKPGTGANSITGQCNAMGSRLFGNATSLVGGYDFANAAHRTHVAGILGIDAALIPAQPSRAYDRILDAVETGEIRALWIIATNTAHSWINSGKFARLRDQLDFLVVQDMYATTETAQQADLVLPAAGWGEKQGVFINSERRLGYARKVARAPGLALSDFSIFKLVAEAWGCGPLFTRWSSPAAALQILKDLSRGQPCDFTGIRDHDHIEEQGGIQWPYPDSTFCRAGSPNPAAPEAGFGDPAVPPPDRERRLFADGQFPTPDGRARFLFDEPAPLPEPVDAAYPFLLNTGRGSSAQWHTGSRTDKSAVLRQLAPTVPWIEIHPTDATALGLSTGQTVAIRSRRGETTALAVVTPIVQPRQVFMPMHFPEVNRLTFPAYDPHSRQPAYKACAVSLASVNDSSA